MPCAVAPMGSSSVSSDRVSPKNRITGPGGAVGERVGVRVDDGVAERDRVGVALATGVGLLLGVAVWVAVIEPDERVGVAVRSLVRDGVELSVNSGEGVEVAEANEVALGDQVGVGDTAAEGDVAVGLGRIGVIVGLRVAVGTGPLAVGDGVEDALGGSVPVALAVGARVRVAVRLAVGVKDGLTRAVVAVAVTVRVAVAVGSNGPGPTRKRICTKGPKFPARSRTATVTNVSPSAKISCRVTCKQNCTCVASLINAGRPKRSLVQANAGAVATAKLQERSLIASLIRRSGRKSGG